jgi:uncharacterized protein (UPF0332 family)
MDVSEKLKNCLKEGEKSERHKGLKKIGFSQERVNGHIAKAIHNFNAIELFSRVNYSDWSASAAFYCLYHGLLALIAKKGFESRNQGCTFALVEQMIINKECSLILDELREIFDRDITENLEQSNKILDLRENMQYSIKTSLEKQELKFLSERTKLLFDKIRKEVEK